MVQCGNGIKVATLLALSSNLLTRRWLKHATNEEEKYQFALLATMILATKLVVGVLTVQFKFGICVCQIFTGQQSTCQMHTVQILKSQMLSSLTRTLPRDRWTTLWSCGIFAWQPNQCLYGTSSKIYHQRPTSPWVQTIKLSSLALLSVRISVMDLYTDFAQLPVKEFVKCLLVLPVLLIPFGTKLSTSYLWEWAMEKSKSSTIQASAREAYWSASANKKSAK